MRKPSVGKWFANGLKCKCFPPLASIGELIVLRVLPVLSDSNVQAEQRGSYWDHLPNFDTTRCLAIDFRKYPFNNRPNPATACTERGPAKGATVYCGKPPKEEGSFRGACLLDPNAFCFAVVENSEEIWFPPSVRPEMMVMLRKKASNAKAIPSFYHPSGVALYTHVHMHTQKQMIHWSTSPSGPRFLCFLTVLQCSESSPVCNGALGTTPNTHTKKKNTKLEKQAFAQTGW